MNSAGARTLGQPYCIQLAGEYDLTRRAEVDALFAQAPADRPITIDLSRVTYMDSTVLHGLALLHARRGEHVVTLLGLNAANRRLLRIAGLDQVFRISEAAG